MWEIRWTEQSEQHIARHDVAPDEVEQVVHGRPVYRTPGRDETTLVFGRTKAGRALIVILAEALDGRQYVATARPMNQNELRTYRRKAT